MCSLTPWSLVVGGVRVAVWDMDICSAGSTGPSHPHRDRAGDFASLQHLWGRDQQPQAESNWGSWDTGGGWGQKGHQCPQGHSREVFDPLLSVTKNTLKLLPPGMRGTTPTRNFGGCEIGTSPNTLVPQEEGSSSLNHQQVPYLGVYSEKGKAKEFSEACK